MKYFDFLLADGLARRVDQGVLFEAEADFEVFVVGAGEVDADGGGGHGFQGLREAELDHEAEWRRAYRT